MPIPFNKPSLQGREKEYLDEALARMHISGDGHFSRLCHGLLERELGAKRALLTTSCTDALELAALLLDIRPGDEIIVPAFTFVSTANAFVLRGARPRFADVRPDTLNLDENKVEALIGPRTKAIVPVHYAGVGCEMDRLREIAARHHLAIVEDNAHGLFAKYRGKYLGTFGQLATQSFHETKNFSCGEGGALLVNDEKFVDRAEILREKGTNRSRFFRGQVDKYSWVDVGSSYLLSDLLAAYLYGQLEVRQKIQRRREQLWSFYRDNLAGWAAKRGIGLPTIPEHCEQSFHLFYILLPSEDYRRRLIQHLRAREIVAVFHYLPLHLSEMGRQLGGQVGDCPVTEDVSDRLLRLPFYNDLTDDDQQRIVEAITTFDVAAKGPRSRSVRLYREA